MLKPKTERWLFKGEHSISWLWEDNVVLLSTGGMERWQCSWSTERHRMSWGVQVAQRVTRSGCRRCAIRHQLLASQLSTQFCLSVRRRVFREGYIREDSGRSGSRAPSKGVPLLAKSYTSLKMEFRTRKKTSVDLQEGYSYCIILSAFVYVRSFIQ